MFEYHRRVTAKIFKIHREWTLHPTGGETGQVSTPTQLPEGELIERLRKAMVPKLSVRSAAKEAGFSASRWTQIVQGYKQETAGLRVPVRAPADRLAQMARVVGATADQLRAVGRDDAADDLVRLQLGRGLRQLIPDESRTPHDDLFRQAEDQLRLARNAVLRVDYESGIRGLEAVKTAAELLIVRLGIGLEVPDGYPTTAESPVPSNEVQADPDGDLADDVEASAPGSEWPWIGEDPGMGGGEDARDGKHFRDVQ